jgi:hypothetical protein
MDLLPDGKIPENVNTSDLGSIDLILLPLLSNHGCFDVVFVKSNAIYCIRCTIKEDHSRKIDFIYSLLDSLKSKSLIPEGINLIGCVPRESFEKFHSEEVSQLDSRSGPEIKFWKTSYGFGDA